LAVLAGLLAVPVAGCLPIYLLVKQWPCIRYHKPFAHGIGITVARLLVISTRFPINPGINREPKQQNARTIANVRTINREGG